MSKKTNPNGANQYHIDPRQKKCWDYYIDPRSKTFSNGYRSAIKAGYTKGTAMMITTMPWFLGKLRRLELLPKSEKVLEEMLDMPVEVLKVEGYGDDRQEVVKTEPSLIKIKQDTAKFLAERLGKDEGYSLRSELTGKDGEDLIPDNIQDNKELQKIITEFEDKLKKTYLENK